MKLSKREKFLLFDLALVAILAAGIYLFINPMNAMCFEATKTLNDLELQEVEYRSMIAMIPGMQSGIDQLKTEINAAETRLPGVLHTGEADETITRIALDYGLTPSGLELEEPETVVIAAFNEPDDTGETGDTDDADVGPTLPVYKLSLRLSGQLNNMVSFINSFVNHGYIRVTSFEIVRQEGSYELAADFTIYMR